MECFTKKGQEQTFEESFYNLDFHLLFISCVINWEKTNVTGIKEETSKKLSLNPQLSTRVHLFLIRSHFGRHTCKQ